MQHNGADYTKTKFVEIPFAEVASALDRGIIDAGMLGEPWLSAANGTTNETQWDSTQQGMLPLAVRISISLRREARKSMFNFTDSESPPPTVYSLLVSLPNASVDTSQQASDQSTPPASTNRPSSRRNTFNEAAVGSRKPSLREY